MNREKRTYLDRLKAIPGQQQAFRLAMKAAIMASRKEDVYSILVEDEPGRWLAAY